MWAQAVVSFVPHGHEFAMPAVMLNVSTYLRNAMGPKRYSSVNKPPLYYHSRDGADFGLDGQRVHVRCVDGRACSAWCAL